jgi:hypothetical protein
VLNRSQKNPTLKIPPSKAWRRLHRANATSPRAGHCIANNPRTVQRSAAHCIATSSQRIASQTIRANATSPRIANNPRTDNQPATHRPPRPLRIIRRTANTSHLQLCTRFAVLCAGFVLFVVLTFPKFNLNTL